jgi:hypothetical protein
MDDLERVSDDADSKELLSIVTALHHQAVRHEDTSDVPI